MTERQKDLFGIPELDLSGIESDEFAEKSEKGASREERLAFIENAEKHPEALSAWDMDIAFEEYARRVKAGDRA